MFSICCVSECFSSLLIPFTQMLLLSRWVRRASAADVNSSNSPDQVRAGIPEWLVRCCFRSNHPNIYLLPSRKGTKIWTKNRNICQFWIWRTQITIQKVFFSLCRKYLCFFLTDIDSALPHEICCGRGNNLQLGFSFYSVISSRNHFVLTVTNAPELFGRPERVSYIYFISLFLTKEFIFFVPDSFWKCVSVLKIRRTTRVHVEIVCRCCRPREAFSNQSTGHQQGQNLRLFSPPIIKCSLLAISALFPLLL